MGTTLVTSIDRYKHYISIVDDYTRYCWIFPLVLKSDALETFKISISVKSNSICQLRLVI